MHSRRGFEVQMLAAPRHLHHLYQKAGMLRSISFFLPVILCSICNLPPPQARLLIDGLVYQRLAQWDGAQQKWYYVQPVTGKSQWEVPTEPFIPTPASTPHSIASPGPYNAPRADSLAPSESEATKELQEVRNGTWRTNDSYSVCEGAV